VPIEAAPLLWWQDLLGRGAIALVVFAANFLVFVHMTWVERRVLAFMQFRLGPNRTGPIGILQPWADAIKLLFKEEVLPAAASKGAYLAAPIVAIIAAFMAIAVVPYGPPFTLFGRQWQLQIADLGVGILYIFAITSLGVYGVVMAGWSANNKWGMLGALRSSAQMFSYELALGLSWVGLILLAGSFRINDIVENQAGWFFLNWNAFKQFPAFVVYMIAACAEVARTPFDLPEGESELVAGFHTEYSSMSFGMLQIAEYINMVTVAVLGTDLFLGGWNSGLPFLPSAGAVGFVWFLGKVGVVLFAFVWLRGTLPRLRYDQLMHFGWKVLVPLAVLNILVTASVVALRGP
jgi:NADH-quinone oxidoreductase subunit H